MSWELTTDVVLYALLVFVLRLLNMSLDTVRLLLGIRNKKFATWMLGFIQSLIFVVAISFVLNNLDNPVTVIAYAAGFATGNILGIYFDEKLAVGHINIRVISPRFGSAIAEKLREEGYAVTEISARGRDGMVTLMDITVKRKEIDVIDGIVRKVDGEAFITLEEMRPLRHGYWRK